MAFIAEIKPVAAVLRVFDARATPGVDAHVASGTVVFRDETTAEVNGLSVDASAAAAMREALFRQLRELGVTKVVLGTENEIDLGTAKEAA